MIEKILEAARTFDSRQNYVLQQKIALHNVLFDTKIQHKELCFLDVKASLIRQISFCQRLPNSSSIYCDFLFVYARPVTPLCCELAFTFDVI